MIRPKILVALPIIAAVLITACSDTTAPKQPMVGRLPTEPLLGRSAAENSRDAAENHGHHSRKRCGREVTFMKWYTAYPFMTGLTCYGPGTYSGEILSRTVVGGFTQLQARYEVKDPRGRRSFKAVIQGQLDNTTGEAVLNGVIIQGWRTGAQVHVTFQRITGCEFATGTFPGICFQGSIQVQRGKRDKGDRDSD